MSVLNEDWKAPDGKSSENGGSLVQGRQITNDHGKFIQIKNFEIRWGYLKLPCYFAEKHILRYTKGFNTSSMF